MGKSKAPPPPDYASAANATAQGNLDAAKFATKANRINQFTPFGSLEYTYTPEFDAEGKETGGGWTQRETLTPLAQEALDQELALNRKYGQTANIGFDKAREIFENPELNTSGLPALRGLDPNMLPKAAINAGQTAQQAIMSRLQPQLQRDDEALRTRLANQGITLGSEAYNRELSLMGQRANDLNLQAAAQGITLDQAARAQALAEQQAFYGQSADQRGRMLEEQAYLQDRPLNLINALRTGNQVQAPQFQQFAQQATTQGPDMLAATQAQYGAQLDAVNAKNAGKSAIAGGLLGIGMGAAGLPVAGGGSLGGNFIKGLF